MAAQYLDDAFLTPVLENDTLLFGLDVDDADFQEGGAASAGAAQTGQPEHAADSALAAENELLKLQVCTVIRVTTPVIVPLQLRLSDSRVATRGTHSSWS